MAEKYYITTAIAYTSGKPHIGNTYEIVLADLLARFKRSQGYDVFFQTGTDEHGEKIELKAAEIGKTPKQFVDDVASDIKRIWDLMDTSYDNFVRTTDKHHESQVQKIFQKLFDQGDIYKGTYQGHYCTPCESFWTESQLADGKCPDCGRDVKLSHEEAYFFRMSKYADRLIKFYDDNPSFIVPLSRKNEMINNFLKPGLQDLCVSRTSFSWGIPVKSDPRHVVYVWLDALTNYITGLGYDCDGNSASAYKKYWAADVHVIGKDIVRFHSIYWPIFLMALGEPLPKQIFGHPWLLQDGGKMSKSKGNVLYADDLAKFFGVDALRYFLLSQMPYDNDGIINWEIVTDTINSDLANVYGNLANRTIAMSNKYFGGIVENKSVCEPIDEDLKAVVIGAKAKVFAKIDTFHIADALADIFAIFRRANKYIDETMPWVLAKDEAQADRLATVLYNLTESIVVGSSLLEPFMPTLCKKVLAQLGSGSRQFADLATFGLLPNGTRVTDTPEILFARLDFKEISEKVKVLYEARKIESEKSLNNENEKSMNNENEKPVNINGEKPVKIESEKPVKFESEKPVKIEGEKKMNNENENQNIVDINEIDITEFAKVQLLVGEILTAEKVEKADKLLKFSVKCGDEVRTVVSGIAKHYTVEEMIGKLVVVVANLKPAKLRGIESQGMLLCACTDTEVVLIAPEKRIASGSQVR